jgi:hypothetical protein
MESTSVSSNQRVENVFIQDGIFFILKREKSVICNNMDESGGHYIK